MFDRRAWNIMEATNSKKKNIKSDKLPLNTFERIDMTDSNIRKYKKSNKGLSHIRTGKDYKGYIYIDSEDNVVGFINMRISDKYIQAIEVSKDYQSKGLGKALLHELLKMGAKRLSVNKKNTIALDLYRDLFSVEKEDNTMYYMVLDSSKCLSETTEVKYKKAFNFTTMKKENVILFEDYSILYEADDDLGPSDYGNEEDVDAQASDVGEEDTGGGDELEAQDYGDEDNIEDTGDSGEEDIGDDMGDMDAGGNDMDMGDDIGGDDTAGTDDESSTDEQTDNENTDENSDDKENNKYLIRDFIELYRRIEEIIEKLNISEQAKLNRDPSFNKVRENLEKIRKVTFDYIVDVFNKESYVSNLYQFNLIIQNINANIELLDNSYVAKMNRESKDKDKKRKSK